MTSFLSGLRDRIRGTPKVQIQIDSNTIMPSVENLAPVPVIYQQESDNMSIDSSNDSIEMENNKHLPEFRESASYTLNNPGNNTIPKVIGSDNSNPGDSGVHIEPVVSFRNRPPVCHDDHSTQSIEHSVGLVEVDSTGYGALKGLSETEDGNGAQQGCSESVLGADTLAPQGEKYSWGNENTHRSYVEGRPTGVDRVVSFFDLQENRQGTTPKSSTPNPCRQASSGSYMGPPSVQRQDSSGTYMGPSHVQRQFNVGSYMGPSSVHRQDSSGSYMNPPLIHREASTTAYQYPPYIHRDASFHSYLDPQSVPRETSTPAYQGPSQGHRELGEGSNRGPQSVHRETGSGVVTSNPTGPRQVYPTEGGPRRREKEPQPFNGSSTTIKDFLIHFDQVSAWNHWDEYERTQQLAMCLRGPALRILSELSESQRSNFKELRDWLIHRFSPPDREYAHKCEFRSRRRHGNETLVEFGEALRSMASLAFPDLSVKERDQNSIEQFIEGLSSFETRKHVQFSRPGSLDEAITRGIEFESFTAKQAGAYNRKPQPWEVEQGPFHDRKPQPWEGEPNPTYNRKPQTWEGEPIPQVHAVAEKPPVQSSTKGVNDDFKALVLDQLEKLGKQVSRQSSRRSPGFRKVPLSEKICYVCGELGHLSYDCKRRADNSPRSEN